ncbi:MAG: hypothetical protein K6F32_07530 [Bacilli bacterium]|nr:hypothetical protein [Bacilli bacterium]
MKRRRIPLIFKILIAIVSVAAIAVGAAAIAITDFTDNTPSYYSEMEGVSTKDYLGDKAEQEALSCGPLDDFEYLFDEEGLNKLMATIVPTIEIPMVNLTSIYFTVSESNAVHAEAPLSALIFKSCVKADGTLSYDEEVITLRIESLKAGLISSNSKPVSAILSSTMIGEIQTSINEAGVHLNMEKDGNAVVITMTNIEICQTIADCCSSPEIGFLSAALAAGALSAKNVDLVVNEDGLTGVVIKKSLI